ncbi:hypothetical protein KEM54_006407 [Ascosphaera aggregata]|nr:hypothetical protein KEM54_006407 [Ascosphaera aggregata]
MSFPPPHGGQYGFPRLPSDPQILQGHQHHQHHQQQQQQQQQQAQRQVQRQAQQFQFQQYQRQFAFNNVLNNAQTYSFGSGETAYYHPAAVPPQALFDSHPHHQQQQQQQQQQQRQQQQQLLRAQRQLPPPPFLYPSRHQPSSPSLFGHNSAASTSVILPQLQPALQSPLQQTDQNSGIGTGLGIGIGLGIGPGSIAGTPTGTTSGIGTAVSAAYHRGHDGRYNAFVAPKPVPTPGLGYSYFPEDGAGRFPSLNYPRTTLPQLAPLLPAVYGEQPQESTAYPYSMTSPSPAFGRNHQYMVSSASLQQQKRHISQQQNQVQQSVQQVPHQPVQLYASPTTPHRVESQQQPPTKDYPKPLKEQQQQQLQQLLQHKSKSHEPRSEQPLSHTPEQEQIVKKPTPQSRASNPPSQRSSFPKIEVHIVKTPRETQNLQQPRSMSPVKEKKPRPKKKSLVSDPAAEDLIPPDLTIDYQTLLLSLADEYMDAAHCQGANLAASRNQNGIEEYYRLIATGLACLETVLKSRRLSPQVEAVVRLRYALIVYEETDNEFEAESALTKGNQLLDLKYTMQQLLARTLFKSNPKAALKAVDGMIQEVEVYGNNAWEYGFRFLRASLSLSSPHQQDHSAGLHNLRCISTAAQGRGDKAIVAVSNALEALAHLQFSSGSETVEQAQRCLAQARSYQLDTELANLPHLSTMLQLVDITISLFNSDSAQAASKLPSLQQTMDANLQNPNWRQDGMFFVPVASAGTVTNTHSGTILRSEKGGTIGLTMSWLSKHDLYAISYFVSAVILSGKTVHDANKAEKYLQEGLGLIADSFEDPLDIGESFARSSTRFEWKQCLRCNMLLQLILIACAKSDFAAALKNLDLLESVAEQLGDALDLVTKVMILYVRGVIHQSMGERELAITIFQDPIFDLETFTIKGIQNCVQRDIAILCALNTALLQYDPESPHSSTGILQRVEPYCHASTNQRVKAAYHIVSATIRCESSVQTKHDLHLAVNISQKTNNAQVTYLAVSYLAWKYFRGVISPQAEKNTMLAHAMAKTADNKLWRSITEELLADSLERHGKPRDAVAARRRADVIVASLPAALREVNPSYHP